MNVCDELKRSGFDFEDFPAPTDIKVSKVFQTPAGDKVRLIPTVGRNVLITGVGQAEAGLDTIIVTGDIDSIAKEGGLAGELWDLGKRAAKALADEFLGGGGGSGGGGGGSGGGEGKQCTTTTTTTIKVGKGGKVESITTTTSSTCSPA